MTDQLLFEIDGSVATITLNRPEKLNAFTEEMINAYVAALRECRDNSDIRAIILTGAGRGFCSGGDVSAMGERKHENTPLSTKARLWDHIQHSPKTLAEMDTPIIAAVNGVAAGAGMDLASHCDFRIAAESARFAESYVKVGLVPGAGGAYFLPRIVGQAMAMELLLTGELIDAQEALRIGYVNHVYPDDQLMDKAREMAEVIAGNAPISVRLIKRAMLQGLNIDMRTHLDQISSHMTLASSSEDHAEAVAAFKEKRKPTFKGK